MDGHPRAWEYRLRMEELRGLRLSRGFLAPFYLFSLFVFDRRFSEWSAVLMDITYLGLWILGKGVLTGWVGQQVLRD
jgi:hypothetical protein